MSTVAVPTPISDSADGAVHPAWLRITHWVNALAVVVMVASGWRIYNASPLYDFVFPAAVTRGLGDVFGGYRAMHDWSRWMQVPR